VQGFIGWYEDSYPAAVPVLEPAAVRMYLVDLRRAGQKPGTVRLRYSALRLFSRWLTLEGEVDRDPLLSMKPPKLDIVRWSCVLVSWPAASLCTRAGRHRYVT
jgi:site-specific recombinase XerC